MIREADGDGTPYRRVLDLLAGWAMYIDGCAEGYPEERAMYEAEAEAIRALYQDLGSRSGSYADLDRQAYAFLGKPITDLVVLGAAPQRSVSR
jgi:hypothetical protein